MAKISFWDREARDWREENVLVVRDAEISGRWNVRRADNRRLLGWINPPGYGYNTGWTAHIAGGAFRGAGPDDEGYILDRVPGYLFNNHGTDLFKSPEIGQYATRREAAEQILSWLVYNLAPALGAGRHPSVEPYRSLV